MEVNSHRLGRIEVPPRDLVEVPLGLVGIEGSRRFAIYRPKEIAPLAWLVSLTDPDLAYAIASVDRFAGEPYAPPIGESDREVLELGPEDEVEVYVFVSPPDGSGGATVNLKGPLVVNARNRRARQLLLYSARFSTRQPLPRVTKESVAEGYAKRAA